MILLISKSYDDMTSISRAQSHPPCCCSFSLSHLTPLTFSTLPHCPLTMFLPYSLQDFSSWSTISVCSLKWQHLLMFLLCARFTFQVHTVAQWGDISDVEHSGTEAGEELSANLLTALESLRHEAWLHFHSNKMSSW